MLFSRARSRFANLVIVSACKFINSFCSAHAAEFDSFCSAHVAEFDACDAELALLSATDAAADAAAAAAVVLAPAAS